MGKVNHINSYYAASVQSRLRDWPELSGELMADVCVVGGGFAGMSTALHLAEKGLSVVLLEKNRVGWGASGRNGGHMESLFGHHPDDFAKDLGKDRIADMWRLSGEASDLVKSIIETHDIDCDARLGIGHVGYTEAHAHHLFDGAEKFLSRGYRKNVRIYDRQELAEVIGTDKYHGGFFDMDMVHLNPLQFAFGFACAADKTGVQIFENSEVLSYSDGGPSITVKTRSGSVRASHLVIAANANVHNVERKLADKLFYIKAWMIATEPLGAERAEALIKDHLAVNDTRAFIDFYRISDDNRLVFGSVAPVALSGDERKIKKVLRDRMLAIYPQLRDVGIDYAWQCKAAGTMKFMPHTGRFRPNIYYSLATNVAWTILNGKLIAESITGNDERFDIVAGIDAPSIPVGVKGRELMGQMYKFMEKLKY
jgi:gamma-glutamylputrescine oxidase